MTVTLDLETSLAYLDGAWGAWNIELDTVETLRVRGISEPTVVVLVDGTVAFYVAKGEVV